MLEFTIQYRAHHAGRLVSLGRFSARSPMHAIEIGAHFCIRNKIEAVEIVATHV